ncbi:DUF1758 domain-containing protein [Trichonephila clavata]|uniref:DUF1758 domain-containing protein n=1 Tax=Trichonephila clavata TaxID=2740835 RepID=A0A8X6L7U1_TRICU|nr:DUF1758 domain-containing protein [Trichonephila clavata]
MTEVHDKYLINLCSCDGKYRFVMEVSDPKKIYLEISRINHSRILQKLATLNVFISDLSACHKLCLFEKHSDEIHILLGSDRVGKLFIGEVKPLSERLTAVNTRLGWTVMRKLSYGGGSKFKSDNSLLANREKTSDLWELDSVGIKDPSKKKSKLELQEFALKHFENTVSRDDKDDVENLEPLTPAMFLQDIREVGVPELDRTDENKSNKRLVYRNRIQTDLRKRFRTYFGQLSERDKKYKGRKHLK